MDDEPTPRPLLSAGAVCRFTGDEIQRDKAIQVVAQRGNGSGDDQAFLATLDRLQAAFHPSIYVDFAAAAEEDGAR